MRGISFLTLLCAIERTSDLAVRITRAQMKHPARKRGAKARNDDLVRERGTPSRADDKAPYIARGSDRRARTDR